MTNEPGINPFAPPKAEIEGAPFGVPGSDEQVLATRWARFLAAFIDGWMYIFAAIPGGIIGFALGGEAAMFGVGLAGLGVLAMCIYQWRGVASTGQTIGKRNQKIRVVKLDGSPVDFVSGVVVRVWVPTGGMFLLSFVLALIGIDKQAAKTPSNLYGLLDALFIFGGAHRCLHDYIAGTKVIFVRGGSLLR